VRGRQTREALFKDLAQAAEEQSQIWLEPLAEPAPFPRPAHPHRSRPHPQPWPRAMRGVLAAMKVRGMVLYTIRPAAPHAARRDDIGRRHRSAAPATPCAPACSASTTAWCRMPR
jgi:vacuolar iron transporter family protein